MLNSDDGVAASIALLLPLLRFVGSFVRLFSPFFECVSGYILHLTDVASHVKLKSQLEKLLPHSFTAHPFDTIPFGYSTHNNNNKTQFALRQPQFTSLSILINLMRLIQMIEKKTMPSTTTIAPAAAISCIIVEIIRSKNVCLRGLALE